MPATTQQEQFNTYRQLLEEWRQEERFWEERLQSLREQRDRLEVALDTLRKQRAYLDSQRQRLYSLQHELHREARLQDQRLFRSLQ
jgi:uncharacterized coiled-coil DUF342 family protein